MGEMKTVRFVFLLLLFGFLLEAHKATLQIAGESFGVPSYFPIIFEVYDY